MDDYKKLLARINEALKQGDKTQIKDRLQERGITVSIETIEKVLNAKFPDCEYEFSIVNAAGSIIKKHKKQQKIKSDSLLAKMKAVGLVS